MKESKIESRAGVAQLPWLRWLRWTAVIGQALTVLYVTYGLRVRLPLGLTLAVVAVAAITNLALHFVPASIGERPRFLAGVLGLDVVLLTLLLRLTGGPHNPFATLYLVLVALAAVALTPRLTWCVAAGSCLGYGSLFLASTWPFRPGDPVCGVGPNLPLAIHLRGMLVAFVLTAVLVGFFVARLQEALRRGESELRAARERAAEHERFAALATLAAGAAHELGSPLGTIAVAAGELARAARSRDGCGDVLDDAELIRREAYRCRAILDRLQNQADDVPQAIETERLLEALAVRFPTVRFGRSAAGNTGRLEAPPDALTQALANLIGNALDASPAGRPVSVETVSVPGWIEFRVRDEGRGLDDEVRAHAGEPFYTTKPPGRGMGLGLFLVRLLARRLSGDFRFERPAGGGTCAVLSLPCVPSGGKA